MRWVGFAYLANSRQRGVRQAAWTLVATSVLGSAPAFATPMSDYLIEGVLEKDVCGLAECIDLAVSRGPELEVARAQKDLAVAQKNATRGNFGPKLLVDGGVQVWDSELATSFSVGIPGVEIPPFVVRDAVTWSVNVTLAQPLTGLWTIYEAHELQALGVDVASLETEMQTADKAVAVAEAWLSTMLADEMIEVRKTSLAQRSSDRERARALVRAGVLVEADLARVDLGVTESRQSLAIAERQGKLARARLTQLVGVAKTPRYSEPTTKAEVLPLAEAKKKALERRVEVRQLSQRLAMAERGVGVATSKMAPNVNLVAAAQFAGGSEFQQDAAAFVGLTFDWTVWEWGATKFGIDEARARVREVKARVRQLEEGIQLETEAAWVDHASALDQAALAAEAVKVAGINYGLVKKRFEAKAATSFDVVEAENALTKAKLDEKMATVAALMARAKLAKAMGGDAQEIAREGTP